MSKIAAVLRGLFTAPVDRYVHGAVLVVLVVAFVTSFESGSAGAGQLGYPDRFTVALPLVCDVVAGVATVIHARVRADRSMRRTATWFVLVPMLLSWGANAVDHVEHAPADPAWETWGQYVWLGGVVLAAGICPVAVAALLHLSTKYAEYERRQAETREKRETAQKTRARRGESTSATPDITAQPEPDEPEPTPSERPQLRVAGEPRPWSGRAQELMNDGVPRATAYRRARKEHSGGDS